MANTFKPTLNAKASTFIQQEERQDLLHRRYKNIDKEVVIVEETPLKTLLQSFGTVIRVLAMVVGVLLAAVGIIALVFESPRNDLIDLFHGLLDEVHAMFGL